MNKVCDGCAPQDDSFAMTLIKEYAKQAKRFFIVALVELAIIFLFVGGIVYFITNYQIEYTELSTDGGNANYVSGSAGDIINGEN